MNLLLNFGAGPNQLPQPWRNLGPEHDIRKRLKFEDNSANAILAEHVIEHVPFLQSLGFFREALRVLKPGGVLRVAFPDIGRFLTTRSLELANPLAVEACCGTDSPTAGSRATRNRSGYRVSVPSAVAGPTLTTLLPSRFSTVVKKAAFHGHFIGRDRARP